MAKRKIPSGRSRTSTDIEVGDYVLALAVVGVGIVLYQSVGLIGKFGSSVAGGLGRVGDAGEWLAEGSEWWTDFGTETAGDVVAGGGSILNWSERQINRATGAPKWFIEANWNLGTAIGEATSVIPEAVGKRYYDYDPEGERSLLAKDDDSWGYGYGPKKGWLFG
tara:strand:- start:12 stop:506 length:495 start_codon:yes stop_codon:yes gene_type:complete